MRKSTKGRLVLFGLIVTSCVGVYIGYVIGKDTQHRVVYNGSKLEPVSNVDIAKQKQGELFPQDLLTEIEEAEREIEENDRLLEEINREIDSRLQNFMSMSDEERRRALDEERRRALEESNRRVEETRRASEEFRERLARGDEERDGRLREAILQRRRSQSIVLSEFFDTRLEGAELTSILSEFDNLLETALEDDPLNPVLLNKLCRSLSESRLVFHHAAELLRISIQSGDARKSIVLTGLVGTVNDNEALSNMEQVLFNADTDIKARRLALRARFSVKPAKRFVEPFGERTYISTSRDEYYAMKEPFSTTYRGFTSIETGAVVVEDENSFTQENRDLVFSWYRESEDVLLRAELLKFLNEWGGSDDVVQNFLATEALNTDSKEIELATLSSMDPNRNRAALTTAIYGGDREKGMAAANALRRLPPTDDTLDYLMQIIRTSAVQYMVRINVVVSLQHVARISAPRNPSENYEDIVSFRMGAVKRIVEHLRSDPISNEFGEGLVASQLLTDAIRMIRSSTDAEEAFDEEVEDALSEFIAYGIRESVSVSNWKIRWQSFVKAAVSLDDPSDENLPQALEVIKEQVGNGVLSTSQKNNLIDELKILPAGKSTEYAIQIFGTLLFDSRCEFETFEKAAEALLNLKETDAALQVLERASTNHSDTRVKQLISEALSN
ncbi:MAG: hypothetical protein NUW37_15345 [Planctomycetes bacterium]|nr:hypothetical protein [Planctomycetota bacterium]